MVWDAWDVGGMDWNVGLEWFWLGRDLRSHRVVFGIWCPNKPD